MTKYKIVGDPKNPPAFSSSIIINSLNAAAKNVGLYSENEKIVVYDCCGNSHGYNADAIICCYETIFPPYIIQNLRGKPVLGVSRDNFIFAVDGGYPVEKVDWFPLGIDSEAWEFTAKKYLLDKYVILSYTESLARSGLEVLIEAFGLAFGGDDSAVLYIKDRNSTSLFEEWIKSYAYAKNINLKYENRHITSVSEELEVFASADVHCYLNRSTTWGMTVLGGMAAGIPTISPAYSGPREYLANELTGLTVDYDMVNVDSEMAYLTGLCGMRNYFFPDSRAYWCKPRVESVVNALQRLRRNPELRRRLSVNGRAIAEKLTWERSAVALSEALGRLLK